MKQGLPGIFLALEFDFSGKMLTAELLDVPTWQEFLHKVKINLEISWSNDLCMTMKNLDPSTKIGIDPTLISACTWLRNGEAIFSIC
jgi:hypothetical protein